MDLITKIDKYEYISFDIFDTLIKRDVEKPEVVFKYIEKQLLKCGSKYAQDFSFNRKRAESEARQKSGMKEIRLHDIYSDFKEISEDDISFLEELENEIEYKICTANLNILPVYHYCIKSKKKIFAISDMYLSKMTICKILENNGFGEIVKNNHLYVSSEIGCTKHSGDLFTYVLQREGIKGSQLLHIGDAWTSDFINARIKGIAPIHIQKKFNNLKYKVAGIRSATDQFMNNRAGTIQDPYERFGYECIGQIITAFCIWLEDKLSGKENEKLYFLSREGQFLQKAYQILFPEEQSEYLYVSRKSLHTLLFYYCGSIEEIMKVIQFPHYFNITQLFELLGLKENTAISEKYHDKKFSGWQDIKTDIYLWNYLQEKITYIREYSREQLCFFEEIMALDNEIEAISVVDIGWRGTMQSYLERYLHMTGKKIKVTGYYLGVNKNTGNTENKIGYLFNGCDCGENEVDENEVFGFGGLLESLFTADHGSVKEYGRKENKVYPVFYEYEGCSGEIEKIQKGALQFVKDIRESPLLGNIEWDNPGLIFSKMQRVGNHPNREEIDLLGNIMFFDAGREESVIGQTEKLSGIRDFRISLYNAGWKIGFLKKRFPFLPATVIYKLLRRNINNK